MASKSLSGSLPDLTSFSYLTYIDLSDNEYTGHIPASWDPLGGLNYINLSGNNLTGFAPSSWIDQPNTNFAWDSLPGTFSNVVAAKNADGHLQTFSYSAEINTFYQSTQNSIYWIGPDGFGTHANIQQVHVTQSVNGQLEVFSVTNEETGLGESGGNFYHYSQMGINAWIFAAENPTGGFGGWAFDCVTARDNQGRVHLFGIGGENVEKIVFWAYQSTANTDDWNTWQLLNGGGGGEINRIAAAKNGEGKIELWGITTTGLTKIIQTGSTNWGGWTTDYAVTGCTAIKAVTLFDGSVFLMILCNGSLGVKLDGTWHWIATNVQSFEAVLDSGDSIVYIVILDSTHVLKYARMRDGSIQQGLVVISGQELTKFSALLRSDGLLEIFGVNGNSAIYYTSQSAIVLDQNCLSSQENQKDCVEPHSTSTTSAQTTIETTVLQTTRPQTTVETTP
ncbi:UNVERIFIED_CONTAM: hypothetical protein HDU68_001876, partial [Siphonaria sp. JEL0065]